MTKLLTIAEAITRYIEMRGGTTRSARVMIYRQKKHGNIKFTYVPLGVSGRTAPRVDSISLDDYLADAHIGRPPKETK